MAPPLKHEISPELVASLAAAAAEIDRRFDANRFVAAVLARLEQLELKDRINLVADELAAGLDAAGDYPAALTTIVGLSEAEAMDRWAVGMFAAWPLCSFVERHGVDHPQQSLAAMPLLTKRWSCEFAIRPYLANHREQTWRHLIEWRDDPHDAVRRLVSEGTRPRLPWGTRLASLLDHPERGITLIAPLRADPSPDVRRSVANHLNDVARARPDLVTETLAQWLDSPQPPDEKLVGHALRTLVKQGDQAAMRLLGFDTEPRISIATFTCRPQAILLGDSIELSATIRSTSKGAQSLVVDYVVHHPTANGSLSPKVFKWTNLRLEPGERLTIEKRRTIKAISTRSYQPGFHRVDLQVAGQVVAETGFDLRLP